MRNSQCIAVGSLFIWVVIGAGGSPPVAQDPIAFTGHGAMFDPEGNEIDVTPAFIEKALQFYLDALLASANDAQLMRFSKVEARLLEGRNWDAQSKLIATSALVEWLLNEVDSSQLYGARSKNKLIQQYLRSRLFPPGKGERFVPPAALTELLGQLGGILAVTGSTPEQRQAYIDECLACGVPTPPDWGSAEWEFVPHDPPMPAIGSLTNEEMFIGSQYPWTGVYTYASTTPRGACIALPRATGPAPDDTIKLLGIVCLGQDTSKACFWDNQENGMNFDIRQESGVPIENFEGGPGLNGGSGDTCTDCHAGENPFIIHPATALGAATAMGDDWYEPLVHPSWPQNPGPSDLLDTVAPARGDPAGPDAGCLSCHQHGESGGRFPIISAQFGPAAFGGTAYCMIVKKATESDPPFSSFTMPDGGNEGDSPGHTTALLEECAVERPIPAFTINGMNPNGCGFAYSFCPSPPAIVADGSISTTFGASYIWGICQTEGLDLPCVEGSETEFPPSAQATHDFGMLDTGPYRIHLRLHGGAFDERKTVEVSICSDAIPTVSEWGMVVMTTIVLIGGVIMFGRRRTAAA